MSKYKYIYIKNQNGIVRKTRILSKNVDKYNIIYTGYIYHGGMFPYADSAGNPGYMFFDRTAKNRRGRHVQQNVYEIKTRRAIGVRLDYNFYPLGIPQESPFPHFHKVYYVPVAYVNHKFEHYDIGNYDEEWRIGLTSDIYHGITTDYNIWREYGSRVDKIFVGLPDKVKGSTKLWTLKELLSDAKAKMQKIFLGGEYIDEEAYYRL